MVLVSELKRIAKSRGLAGYSKLHKEELIALIDKTSDIPEKTPTRIQPSREKRVNVPPEPIVKTEDLGKIFERAICLLYDIPFNGKYKYGDEEANILKDRLKDLKTLFEKPIHNGGHHEFDFSNSECNLSAKTSKTKEGRIAPQCIGQIQPLKFCETVNIPKMEVKELKKYIQEKIAHILPTFEKYTFSNPIVYFNRYRNEITYIERVKPIDWENINFRWTVSWDKWKNSSTLYANSTSIFEIQFHSKSRTNMANRWKFENVLKLFADNFKIIKIDSK